MATFTTANNRYEGSFTLAKQTGSTLEIPINGYYANKNIFITMNVQSGSAAANSAATSMTVSTVDGNNAAKNISSDVLSTTATEPSSGYYVAITSSATGSSKITKAGWMATGALPAATTTTTQYFPLKSAAITVTASGALSAPVAETSSATITGKQKITLTPQTSTSISTVYYTALKLTETEKTISVNKSNFTSGYLGDSNQVNTSNLTLSATTATYYLPIAAASVTNAASGSATMTNVTFSYDASNTRFNLTSTTALSGQAILSVSSAGWLPQQDISGDIAGTAALSTTVARIDLKASISGDGARKPSVTRTNTTATTAINVGSAAATTAVPTSGYFVSVQSQANTATLTASPQVKTAGYGTTANYGATDATATIGAAASDITYIPIASGSDTANSALAEIGVITADGSAAGINVSSILGTRATTEPTTGYYIALSATGSGSSKISQAGWFPLNAVLTTASTTITRYFPITQGTLEITGGGLSSSTGYASLSTDGYYNGTSYNTSDKVTLTTTEASGYYKITASGYGTVERAQVNKRITQAGYFPQNSTAISAIAASSTTSNTGSTAYYIKKSTLSATSVTSSNDDQTVTISAGYYPTERTVTVNKMTTQTPTTSYTYSGMTTYFEAGTASSNNVSITPRYTNSAGYVAAHTNTNNGGIGYWKIKTSTATSTITTVSGNSATRGTYTQNVGWIASNTTMTVATFANTATAGKTYVDISETTQAPILISGDYLYINAGYTDNLKISLAKLIPDDEGTIAIGGGHILQGYAAYNASGTLLPGTIPTRDATNLSTNGAQVTIPEGYYATATNISITSGQYNAGITLSDITITPSVTLHANATSTYGFTTTTPSSGSDGTNFLKIDPTANTPTYSATGTAIISQAGYLALGSTASTTSRTVSVNGGTNYYVPITSINFDGGGLTPTNYNKNDLAVSLTNASDTNMENIALGDKATATYAYFFKVQGETPEISGNTTVTRATATYSNNAGVIAKHNSGTTAFSTTSVSPTVHVNRATATTYINIKAATMTYSGGALNNKGATASFTGISTTATDSYNNGLKIATSGQAGREAITYTNTAGYIPAHNTNQTASSAITQSSWNGSSYYLTGVTLAKPASGTAKFDITVPNGDSTITFEFQVTSTGEVYVLGPD